jgi:glycosyltransferase involved in cell wall biosynthesis
MLSISNNVANYKIMLFDLATGGHHASYIRHLIDYYDDKKFTINIVVSPKFIEEHSDVVKIATDSNQSNISFTSICLEEYSDLINTSSLLNKIFKEWNLYCKYAKELKADHSLLMFLDTLQLPIVLGQKSPCPFSGIYFRPTFHYDEFDEYVSTYKDRFRQWRQKLLLSQVLHNSQFRCLFSLDEFAIKHIEKLSNYGKVFHLPDPVKIYESEQSQVDELRKKLEIDFGKKIFLLFGRLTARKGIYKLLEAVQILPNSISEKICLLLVGSIPSKDRILIQSQIEIISQSMSIQIVICDEFIPEDEVHLYFRLADVILATYQKHVGMSGVLLLAAAGKKAVLASNYGLMGHLVRQKKLGIAVDSTSPQAITDGLISFINNDQPQANFFDVKMMDKFVEENLADKYSQTVFQGIYAQIKTNHNL